MGQQRSVLSREPSAHLALPDPVIDDSEAEEEEEEEYEVNDDTPKPLSAWSDRITTSSSCSQPSSQSPSFSSSTSSRVQSSSSSSNSPRYPPPPIAPSQLHFSQSTSHDHGGIHTTTTPLPPPPPPPDPSLVYHQPTLIHVPTLSLNQLSEEAPTLMGSVSVPDLNAAPAYLERSMHHSASDPTLLLEPPTPRAGSRTTRSTHSRSGSVQATSPLSPSLLSPSRHGLSTAGTWDDPQQRRPSQFSPRSSQTPSPRPEVLLNPLSSPKQLSMGHETVIHNGIDFVPPLRVPLPTTNLAKAQVPTTNSDDRTFGSRVFQQLVNTTVFTITDRQNALILSRALQVLIDWSAPHEAWSLLRLVRALDTFIDTKGGLRHERKTAKSQLKTLLKEAFRFDNVARLMTLSVGALDVFWHNSALARNRRTALFFGAPLAPTESTADSVDNATDILINRILGGAAVARFLTGGRGDLVSDGRATQSQNLAEAVNQAQTDRRGQQGTHLGRLQHHQWRHSLRLPGYETIQRGFVSSPVSTMVDNGVELTLEIQTAHWLNILENPFGNFAHQRMELLDPFAALRIQMPAVLAALVALRGANRADSEFLFKTFEKLENLEPTASIEQLRSILKELYNEVVPRVCGGVTSRVNAVDGWLDAIYRSLDQLVEVRDVVGRELDGVAHGIDAGVQLMEMTDWDLPEASSLSESIDRHIIGLGRDGGFLMRHQDLVLPYLEMERKGTLRRELEALAGMDDDASKKKHSDLMEMSVSIAHLTPAEQSKLRKVAKKKKRTMADMEILDGVIRGAQLSGIGFLYRNAEQAHMVLRRGRADLSREARNESIRKVIKDVEYVLAHRMLSKDVKVLKRLASCTDSVPALASNLRAQQELDHAVGRAMDKLSPKDRRTLVSMVHAGHADTRCVELLKARVQKLLAREIRRSRVDETLTVLRQTDPEVDVAIARAQRAWMHLELKYLTKFAIEAFNESSNSTRNHLLELQTLATVHSPDLDVAKLTILAEAKDRAPTVPTHELVSGDRYWLPTSSGHIAATYHGAEPGSTPILHSFVDEAGRTISFGAERLQQTPPLYRPPQSLVVAGGGPTGMLCAVHACEAVLASGGRVSLHEKRDSTEKGASAFERSQIVRLDPRWIVMLRYHCGTDHEDVFVPLRNETHPHLSGIFPDQGFVELTIKQLEDLLLLAVTKRLATPRNSAADGEGLLSYYTGSAVQVGERLNSKLETTRELFKEGAALKTGDVVLLTDEDKHHLSDGLSNDAKAMLGKGTAWRVDSVDSSMVRMVTFDASENQHISVSVAIKALAKHRFRVDLRNTHVLRALGKSKTGEGHFKVTCEEYYIVGCIGGALYSGAHDFGNSRLGSGVVNTVRVGFGDDNSRRVGDFTKSVSVEGVACNMLLKLKHEAWSAFISGFESPQMPDVLSRVSSCLEAYAADIGPRASLQVRFFETGDNTYLGMEVSREFIRSVQGFLKPLDDAIASEQDKQQRDQLSRSRFQLSKAVHTLWLQATFDTLGSANVYNAGAKERLPKVNLVDYTKSEPLHALQEGEPFWYGDSRFEHMGRGGFGKILARDSDGRVMSVSAALKVRRSSQLTRGPDGKNVSAVALSAFPVALYVDHHAATILEVSDGTVDASVGDDQASPHFMRYSGLTGAAINAMAFGEFLEQSLTSTSTFADRLSAYRDIVDWSDNEVVIRGIGTGFGTDGFLRPAFSYDSCYAYVHAKASDLLEVEEIGDCYGADLLNKYWKHTIGSGLVPIGMEHDQEFVEVVQRHLVEAAWRAGIKEAVRALAQAGAGEARLKETERALLSAPGLCEAATLATLQESLQSLFNSVMATSLENKPSLRHATTHVAEVAGLAGESLLSVFDFCGIGASSGQRTASLSNPTSPIDAYVRSQHPEAQGFINGVTTAGVQGAAARLVASSNRILATGSQISAIGGAVSTGLGVLSPVTTFVALVNASRYKRRHEDVATHYHETQLPTLKKAVFHQLSCAERNLFAENPFYFDVQCAMAELELVLDHHHEDVRIKEDLQAKVSAMKDDCDQCGNDQGQELSVAATALFDCLRFKLIADTFQHNPYAKDKLWQLAGQVDLYRAHLEGRRVSPTDHSSKAADIYRAVLRWEPRHASTLNLGGVKTGFRRSRKVKNGHIAELSSWIYNYLRTPFCGSALTTTSLQPRLILRDLKELDERSEDGASTLTGVIADLELLDRAKRESQKASGLMLSAGLGGLVSILGVIGRVFEVSTLSEMISMVQPYVLVVPSAGVWIALAEKQAALWTLSSKLKALAKSRERVAGAESGSGFSSEDEETLKTLQRLLSESSRINMARLVAASGVVVAALTTPPALSFAEDGSVVDDGVSQTSVTAFAIGAGAAVVGGIAAGLAGLNQRFRSFFKLPYDFPSRVRSLFKPEIRDIYHQLKQRATPAGVVPNTDAELRRRMAQKFFGEWRVDLAFAGETSLAVSLLQSVETAEFL